MPYSRSGRGLHSASGSPSTSPWRFVAGLCADELGTDRDRYANRRVIVVGSGYSAFNALLDLGTLSEQGQSPRNAHDRSLRSVLSWVATNPRHY